ncbi:hypothetical protein [Amycolatopsis rubida]|nr:hypothetical protein [Amycolatopsis rubida]
MPDSPLTAGGDAVEASMPYSARRPEMTKPNVDVLLMPIVSAAATAAIAG